MPITLQSTVGGFSGEFMRRLPKLEETMLAHGLEPSEFRDLQGPRHAAHGAVPRAVLQRCIAEDDAAPAQAAPRRPGLIGRIVRWMEQPI
jgi:hypothetical protein